MRRERRATCEDAETITYTFHFQISNNGGRQACSVKVQAPNVHDATKFFRQNWPMIESMARSPCRPTWNPTTFSCGEAGFEEWRQDAAWHYRHMPRIRAPTSMRGPWLAGPAA